MSPAVPRIPFRVPVPANDVVVDVRRRRSQVRRVVLGWRAGLLLQILASAGQADEVIAGCGTRD